MSSNEARQIVMNGLERKKMERAKRDAELEKQERLLRITINDNHLEKTISEEQRKQIQAAAAKKYREVRAERRAQRAARDQNAEEIIHNYGILCLMILLVTAITRLNLFVAVALTLGMAVFPVVDIYRLYVPMEEVQK